MRWAGYADAKGNDAKRNQRDLRARERQKAEVNDTPYLIKGPALISFSGGRSSRYMLKHILDAFGGTLPDDIKVAFANTGKEFPETLDFVQEVATRYGVHIVWLEYDPNADHRTAIVSHNSASRNGEPFEAVIRSRSMLPNPVISFCTIELKIRRFREYAVHHLGWKHWTSIVGLRGDEQHRVKKQLKRNEAGKDLWITDMPMAAAGVARRDVSAWSKQQPFDLGLPDIKGRTPMGNCDLCFKKGMKTIKGIMRLRPETPHWWIRQEVNAPGLGTMDVPGMALFRADRPSYARLFDTVKRQGDFEGLPEFDEDEESVDCGCTD